MSQVVSAGNEGLLYCNDGPQDAILYGPVRLSTLTGDLSAVSRKALPAPRSFVLDEAAVRRRYPWGYAWDLGATHGIDGIATPCVH